MSEANLAIVRGLYEAFARRDNESPFEVFDPEIEWDVSRWGDLGLMGFDDVYLGHDGVRRYWRQWLDAWQEIEFEVAELIDAGSRVLAAVRQTNVGHESGIPVEMPSYWQLWTVRDGKVIRMEGFLDREEARGAADLSD